MERLFPRMFIPKPCGEQPGQTLKPDLKTARLDFDFSGLGWPGMRWLGLEWPGLPVLTLGFQVWPSCSPRGLEMSPWGNNLNIYSRSSTPAS